MKKIIIGIITLLLVSFVYLFFDKGLDIIDFVTNDKFNNSNTYSDTSNNVVENDNVVVIEKINKIKIHIPNIDTTVNNYSDYVPVIMVKSRLTELNLKLKNLTKIDHDLNKTIYPYFEFNYNDGTWGEVLIINENTIGIKYEYDNNFYVFYKLKENANILTFIKNLYNN